MILWLHLLEDEALTRVVDWVRLSGIETLWDPGRGTRSPTEVLAVASHAPALWELIARASGDPSAARAYHDKILAGRDRLTNFDLHRGMQYALGCGLEAAIRASARHRLTVPVAVGIEGFFTSYCGLRTGPCPFPLVPSLAEETFQRFRLARWSARSDYLYLFSEQLRQTIPPVATEPGLGDVEQAVRDCSVYVSQRTDHSWRLAGAQGCFSDVAEFVNRGVADGLAWVARQSSEDGDYD